MINRFIKVVDQLQLKHPNSEISAKTGEDKGNVSKYLNGKMDPPPAFLKRFCSAFEVDISTIIPREITVGELIKDLSIFPMDASILFGDGQVSFYRTKMRGEDLIQIEFNETESPSAIAEGVNDKERIKSLESNLRSINKVQSQTAKELKELKQTIAQMSDVINSIPALITAGKKGNTRGAVQG